MSWQATLARAAVERRLVRLDDGRCARLVFVHVPGRRARGRYQVPAGHAKVQLRSGAYLTIDARALVEVLDTVEFVPGLARRLAPCPPSD